MSLYTFGAGLETQIATKLTTTSATTLVSAGNRAATVLGLRVTEVANATPTIILDIYDGSAVVAYVVNLRAMTAREMWNAVALDGIPIPLKPGQSLRATASAADQIHITGIYIEPSN